MTKLNYLQKCHKIQGGNLLSYVCAVGTTAAECAHAYDFIGTTERFDESLVVLSHIMVLG